MYKGTIPVFLAPNNAYAPHAGITITSMMENASKDYFYEIHVLHTDLNNENIKLFHSMKYENASVTCYCITRFIEKELKLMYTNFHFSKEMFYRILIPDVFKQYDKAIYLDSDIAVLGDISEFYNIDLEGNILGGINDVMHSRSKNYVTKEIQLDPYRYINSGVLLIDCKLYREENIKQKIFDELKVRDSLRYPDQDLINIVCNGRIKFLPRKWNYIWHYHIVKTDHYLNLDPDEMKQYLADADDIRILHFTSGVKPWNNTMIPLSKHYWEYVPKCVFEKSIRSSYEKIPRKSYVGFHFLDSFDDYIEITSSIYSDEGVSYDDVVTCIDGNEIETEFITSHAVELTPRFFQRSFFKFKIFRSQITDELKINFYNKNTGIAFPKFTSSTFPLDFLTKTSMQSEDVLVYSDGSNLFVNKAATSLVSEKKKVSKDVSKKLRKNGNDFAKKAGLIRMAHNFAKLFIKKDIWLISDRADSAGDNGEALFEYLKKHKIKGVKPYFVLKKSSKDYKRLKRLGSVVEPETMKYKLLYTFATRNISSQFEYPIMNPIACNTYLKDTLRVKNVFLQHGITKDDLSSCYNRFVNNIHLFVTAANEEYKSIIENPAYGCGPSITKLIGFPRFDKLNNEAEKIIFILPTWRRNCLMDIKSCELVGDFEKSSYYTFYKSLLSDNRLISAARENGYKLCFYPHHLMRMSNDYFKDLDDVFIDASKYSYTDVFKKGAILFTDYSSTQFDFAYLKKPIIYCHFDRDEFFATHTYKQGYFSYEENGFGDVTYNLDDAVSSIIEAMKNGAEMKDVYKQRVDNFFAYTDKENCKRTVDAILSLK